MTAQPPRGNEAEGGEELLGAAEVRSRAASGAALLGARGALIYALGIAANLLLARLLVPRDFGLVTLGTVVLVVGQYLGEAGAGPALIRRDRAPSRSELEAVNAFQLAIAVAIAAACCAALLPFGRDGAVIAVMVASLPIWVLRGPSVVVLERELQYRPIATADVLEAALYYLWAVGTVVLGFGVWGMATAVIVRALTGSVAIVRLGPVGWVWPRWSWRRVRPLLGFAAKFQASAVLHIAREQGLNLGVAAVAGVTTLGVWNLASRILQIPNLLFAVVGRVAYPAMSRLHAVGEDPRPVIERTIAALAALTGVVVVALVGIGPGLPELVGPGWGDLPLVLLWSGIALLLGAPIAAGTYGYLLASDQAGVVVTATLISSAVWLGVALPLLPVFGAPAVGVGWVAATIPNCAVLWRRTAARTGATIAGRLAGPLLVSALATGTAWFVAHRGGETFASAGVAVVAGELLLFLGLAAVARPVLRDTRMHAARALASFRAP